MISLPSELVSLVLSYLSYQSFPALMSVSKIVNSRCASESCLRSLFQDYEVTTLSYSQLQRGLSHIAHNTTYFHPSYRQATHGRLYPLRWAQDEYLIDIFDRLLELCNTGTRIRAESVNHAYPYIGGCAIWCCNGELRFLRGYLNQCVREEVDEVRIIDNRIIFQHKGEWYLWVRTWSAFLDIEKLSPSVTPYHMVVNGTLSVMGDKYGFDYMLDDRGCLSHRYIIIAEGVRQFWQTQVEGTLCYLTFDGRLFVYDDNHRLVAEDIEKVIVRNNIYYLTYNKDLYHCDLHSDPKLIMRNVDAMYLWSVYLYFVTDGNLYALDKRVITLVLCPTLPLAIKEMSLYRVCNDKGNEVSYYWCKR